MTDLNHSLSIRPISIHNLERYVALLNLTFGSDHFSKVYLHWLYFENPNGHAVGFDAFDKDLLVAHYVCIPISLTSTKLNGLLSLNTAVHPKYQGLGLFRTLAENTFDLASAKFACVIGVANSQSKTIFTQKLGFKHIGDLNLRVGGLWRDTSKTRSYSIEELCWRSRSPLRPLTLKINEDDNFAEFSFRFLRLCKVRATVPIESKEEIFQRRSFFPLGITLDWSKDRKNLIQLPSRFKPSPLSLIFKNLGGADQFELTSWSFPDFDAF